MIPKCFMPAALLIASLNTYASGVEKLKIHVSNRSTVSKWVAKKTNEKYSTIALLAASPSVDDIISAFSLDIVYECDAVVGQVTGVPGAGGDVQQVYSLEKCKPAN